MENLWSPDIDIFHCDKNAYKKGRDFNLKRIREADIVHLHSNGICPLYHHYFRHDHNAWQELISSRLRLSVIRNPIAKFESEWGSYVERKNAKMLAHVPNFDFGILCDKALPIEQGFGGWHGQEEHEQIDINTMVDIFVDVNYHGLPQPIYSTDGLYRKLGLTAASNYFYDTRSDSRSSSAINFFTLKNKQYHSIAVNLSTDFLFTPRLPFREDILIVNENLDRSLAALVVSNPDIRRLTRFAQDERISYPDALTEIRKMRTHSRSEKFKSDDFRLTARNRMRYYLSNRMDFSIWQSAALSSSKWIRGIEES